MNSKVADSCGFVDIALSWKSLGEIAKQIRTMQNGLTEDECAMHKPSKEKKAAYLQNLPKAKSQRPQNAKI